jgi:hypothetical protein
VHSITNELGLGSDPGHNIMVVPIEAAEVGEVVNCVGKMPRADTGPRQNDSTHWWFSCDSNIWMLSLMLVMLAAVLVLAGVGIAVA